MKTFIESMLIGASLTRREERREIFRGGSRIGQSLQRSIGNFEHSRLRAKERYNLEFTPEIEAELVRRAASGLTHLSRFLGHYSASGDVYEVYYARQWYRVGIDVLRGCVITFLPHARYTDDYSGTKRANMPRAFGDWGEDKDVGMNHGVAF